jgi:hypothetical protein
MLSQILPKALWEGCTGNFEFSIFLTFLPDIRPSEGGRYGATHRPPAPVRILEKAIPVI